MSARIAALYSHPIKGFTPQRRERARLEPGAGFPGDRLFAVEDGPSGFDPAAPRFIPKKRFAVLARIAEVAAVRTHYDEAAGKLRASAPGAPEFEASIASAQGRDAFSAWLAAALGEAAQGPLRLIDGAGHRFFDDPAGHVSVLNLESVRALEARIGKSVDARRFRANIHVDGWPAWVENGWSGRELRLGAAGGRVVGTITRCAAPDVDPDTAERDLEITAALHAFFGHMLCGIYVQIVSGGEIGVGDAVSGPLAA
ncbi:MAG TPA: MOSC N-terminal beta barrel domain-containing protein [Caulobacteraceae bacterium]|nr:MOSC N-terminal beta barrel domain-containing protein [Caulobacteraceae bacterium]